CFAELGLAAMPTPVVISCSANKRPREDYRPRRLRPLPVSGMCLQHDGTQYAIRSCPVGGPFPLQSCRVFQEVLGLRFGGALRDCLASSGNAARGCSKGWQRPAAERLVV